MACAHKVIHVWCIALHLISEGFLCISRRAKGLSHLYAAIRRESFLVVLLERVKHDASPPLRASAEAASALTSRPGSCSRRLRGGGGKYFLSHPSEDFIPLHCS